MPQPVKVPAEEAADDHEPSALETAIDLVGGVSALSKKIGVATPQVVANWRRRGQVPAEYCAAVELATESRVTRAQLNPKIFGDVAPMQKSAGAAS